MKENQAVMVDTLNNLRNSKNLINNYDGNDAPVYRRKLANISEKVEEVIQEIREKEEKGLVEARNSMRRLSEHSTGSEEARKEGES